MREHGLQPKISRRHVATTDSDHDQPIFPNLAKDTVTDGPDQLWVAAPIRAPLMNGILGTFQML